MSTAQSILMKFGFTPASPARASSVKNDSRDVGSLDWVIRDAFLTLWSGYPEIRAIQKFGEALAQEIPVKITSIYREKSTTHRDGAVDFAPDLPSDLYAHNRRIDPRLYARPEVLNMLRKVHKALGADGALFQILVEDNHFHVHPEIVRRNLTSLPNYPLMIQLNSRPGYERSERDELEDEQIFEGKPWIAATPAVIQAMPPFTNRFPIGV